MHFAYINHRGVLYFKPWQSLPWSLCLTVYRGWHFDRGQIMCQHQGKTKSNKESVRHEKFKSKAPPDWETLLMYNLSKRFWAWKIIHKLPSEIKSKSFSFFGFDKNTFVLICVYLWSMNLDLSEQKVKKARVSLKTHSKFRSQKRENITLFSECIFFGRKKSNFH